MSDIILESLRKLNNLDLDAMKESLEADAEAAHDMVVKKIFEPRGLHEKRWAIANCKTCKVIAHVFDSIDEVIDLLDEFVERSPADFLSNVGKWHVAGDVADRIPLEYNDCDLDLSDEEEVISFYYSVD